MSMSSALSRCGSSILRLQSNAVRYFSSEESHILRKIESELLKLGPEASKEEMADKTRQALMTIPKVKETIKVAPDYAHIWPNRYREGFRPEVLKEINLTHCNAETLKRAYGFQNAGKPELNRQVARQMIEIFGRQNGDTGSPEVQMGVMTVKINYLIDHCQRHPKDKRSRRGLEMLVSKRRRIMDFFKRTNYVRYKKCIRMLSLRDDARAF